MQNRFRKMKMRAQKMYNIGEKVTFFGTVSRVEEYRPGKFLYYVKEWPGIPFPETVIEKRNRSALKESLMSRLTEHNKRLISQFLIGLASGVVGSAIALLVFFLAQA